ncbi:hypothetical protein ACOMHN_044754 [Nucella lapillus]
MFLLTQIAIWIVATSQRSWTSPASSGDNITQTTAERHMMYGDIHIDADTALKCLNQSQFLQYHAKSGIIHTKYKLKLRRKRECQIRLLTSPEKIYRFDVPSNFYTKDMWVKVWDARSRMISHWQSWNPPYAFSVSNNVTVSINQRGRTTFFAPFNITFMSVTQQPQIEVYRHFNTSGYVQSPLWDDHTAYATGLDSWAEVEIPKAYGMMMSFSHLSLLTCHASLDIYQAGRDSAHFRTRVKCSKTLAAPAVYNQTVHLHFRSGQHNRKLGKGFRMTYTLVPLFELLQKVDVKGTRLVKDSFGQDGFYDKENLWNCSVSSWKEFVSHFPCNGRWNCVSGEDEQHCPYTNDDLCGPGQLWTNDSCHQLFAMEDSCSWNQSSVICKQKGGQLSSLNSLYEWGIVARHLALKNKQNVFFGISTFSLSTSLIKPYWRSNKIKPPTLSPQNHTTWPVAHVRCTSEEQYANQSHVTHQFLACDPKSDCLVGEECGTYFDLPLPPSFLCGNEWQEVAYTLVCDHRDDCSDRSDERFCVFPPCPQHSTFDCGDRQCIGKHQRCDFMNQCVMGTDEKHCLWKIKKVFRHYNETLLPPAIVDMDSRGLLVIKPLSTVNHHTSCPSSHFQCHSSNYYCLPIYLRCNKVYDCPGHEDEADCDVYTCPGYYRCRDSSICVHADHVCDHRYGQCPQNDDELLCDFSCPGECRCFGMAFYCSQSVDVSDHPDLRYLKSDRTNTTLMDLEDNTMLIHVSLAGCFLLSFQAPNLPNLKILDLSNNLVSHILPQSLKSIKQLNVLKLAGNPLDLHLSSTAITAVTHLRVLDLSHVHVDQFNASNFEPLAHLHTLNLSHSGLNQVFGVGFQALKSLRSVDLRQCPVNKFPPDMFHNMRELE